MAVAQSWSALPPISRGVAVSFQYDSLLTPGIIVQASINNGKPLRFLVDTGLSIPLLLAIPSPKWGDRANERVGLLEYS
jgi:hypothetical protein